MYKYFSLMASIGQCFFCSFIYQGNLPIKTVDQDWKKIAQRQNKWKLQKKTSSSISHQVWYKTTKTKWQGKYKVTLQSLMMR